MSNEKTCFVICPIGDNGTETRIWSDLTFQYIIKPVVERFGYNPVRADHIKKSGMITDQIIEHLIESELVIADLTNNNPNVFYELAIRHSTKKAYIQMMKYGQRIPFDINGMRTIFFDIDLAQAEHAKDELIKQIESIEKEEFKAINPITLAHNSSLIQQALQNNTTDFKIDDIARVLVGSITEIGYAIAEIRREISVLKESGKEIKFRNNFVRKESENESAIEIYEIERNLIKLKNEFVHIETQIRERHKEMEQEMNLSGIYSSQYFDDLCIQSNILVRQIDNLEKKRMELDPNFHSNYIC